jgi:hypothetical protein
VRHAPGRGVPRSGPRRRNRIEKLRHRSLFRSASRLSKPARPRKHGLWRLRTIDLEREPKLAELCGLRLAPALIAINRGTVVFKVEGGFTPEYLRQVLEPASPP